MLIKLAMASIHPSSKGYGLLHSLSVSLSVIDDGKSIPNMFDTWIADLMSTMKEAVNAADLEKFQQILQLTLQNSKKHQKHHEEMICCRSGSAKFMPMQCSLNFPASHKTSVSTGDSVQTVSTKEHFYSTAADSEDICSTSRKISSVFCKGTSTRSLSSLKDDFLSNQLVCMLHQSKHSQLQSFPDHKNLMKNHSVISHNTPFMVNTIANPTSPVASQKKDIVNTSTTRVVASVKNSHDNDKGESQPDKTPYKHSNNFYTFKNPTDIALKFSQMQSKCSKTITNCNDYMGCSQVLSNTDPDPDTNNFSLSSHKDNLQECLLKSQSASENLFDVKTLNRLNCQLNSDLKSTNKHLSKTPASGHSPTSSIFKIGQHDPQRRIIQDSQSLTSFDEGHETLNTEYLNHQRKATTSMYNLSNDIEDETSYDHMKHTISNVKDIELNSYRSNCCENVSIEDCDTHSYEFSASDTFTADRNNYKHDVCNNKRGRDWNMSMEHTDDIEKKSRKGSLNYSCTSLKCSHTSNCDSDQWPQISSSDASCMNEDPNDQKCCSPFKSAKIHKVRSRVHGELTYVAIGKAFSDFVDTHSLLKGINLYKGKRDIKKQYICLRRQSDAIVRTDSWKRAKAIQERNRLDDFFVLTEVGCCEQKQVLCGKKRDQYVVNWYMWCPGHGKCTRKCGGVGLCIDGKFKFLFFYFMF